MSDMEAEVVNKEHLLVLDPTFEPTVAAQGMAPRPDTLSGKTVGLFANDKMNSEQLLEAIYDVLAERFDVVGSHSLNKGDASAPAGREMVEKFASEVDVALIANGD